MRLRTHVAWIFLIVLWGVSAVLVALFAAFFFSDGRTGWGIIMSVMSLWGVVFTARGVREYREVHRRAIYQEVMHDRTSA